MSARRGEVRIIAGAWRSRRIRFPAAPGLRPTPDRLRETLFNWLGPWIEGKRVLDLYAGSGALGIEALSRGAAAAVFVERSRRLAAAIRENLAWLGVVRAKVVCADALRFLERHDDKPDLVFVDPPYADAEGAAAAMRALARAGVLPADHRVYFEQRRGSPSAPGWELLRSAAAGDAEGRLLRLAVPVPPAGNLGPVR